MPRHGRLQIGKRGHVVAAGSAPLRAKTNDIHGIGLYGELNEPSIPQYRTAKSVIKTLEKLTYQSFGDTHELDVMADTIEKKLKTDWRTDF